MSLNKEPLPGKEAAQVNHQVDSSAMQASAQDILALEALRRALCDSGIDHDCWEFIASKCLDGLKASGVVAMTLEDILRGASPKVQVDFTLHQADGGRTKAEAEVIAALAIANLPEAHLDELHGSLYNCKWLSVTSGKQFNGCKVDIFFTEEVAPHA